MRSAEARRRAEAWAEKLTHEELIRMAHGIRLPDEITFLKTLQIEDKVCGGLIDFTPWDFQEELIAELDQHDQVMVLKARQLGITWTVLGHLLYAGTFWGNRLFLIFSQSGDDAVAALQRIRLMHDSMPEAWRPAKLKDNTKEIVFANGSRYKAMKATKRAGRGLAPYAVLADELAFWAWPAVQMATIEAGAARICVVTTGNGPDDHAHHMWLKAQAGEGEYTPIFYPWNAHPDRDEEWYRRKVVESAEPRLARREFAANPQEAFAAPEGVFFERWQDERNAPKPFRPAANWETWRCVDFGYHWPACLWVQISPKGQYLVVSELAQRESRGWTTAEFAEAILERDAELNLAMPIRGTFCDPAGKAKEVTTGTSEFEIFSSMGLAPIGKPSSVRDGCVRITDEIAHPALPLLVSRSCKWTVEALTTIAADKSHPDVYDEGSVYTHALDALRYFLVNQTRAAAPYRPMSRGFDEAPFGGVFSIY